MAAALSRTRTRSAVPTFRCAGDALDAGHPPPMVLRHGHRVDLSSDVCLPVGLAGATVADAKLAETYLEPGDLVLVFTDGVVEARSAGGTSSGVIGSPI